jgi:ribonuclease J
VWLMEGTHIGHTDHRGPTEYKLEDEITAHIQSAPGLVMAPFSPQHVDRLVGFFRATKKTNRIFMADTYTAFVMHLIASETPVEQSYKKKRLERFFNSMSPTRIGMDEIRSNPSRYLILFRPSMLESDSRPI